MEKQEFNLKILQQQNMEWATKNFPNPKPYQPLLGVIEEVGELAHAHLKAEQGIRGKLHQEEKIDAVGDIVIYLAHYCTLNNIDMNDAVYNTWKIASARDWVKFPGNGKDK